MFFKFKTLLIGFLVAKSTCLEVFSMQRLLPQCLRRASQPEELVSPEMDALPMVIYDPEASDDDFTQGSAEGFKLADLAGTSFPEPSQGALITTANERLLRIFRRTFYAAIEQFLSKTVPCIPSTQAFTEKAYSLLPSKDTLSDTALCLVYNGVLLTIKAVSAGIELSAKALTVVAQTSDQVGQTLGVESQQNGLGLPKAIAQCAQSGALQVVEISVEIFKGFGQEVVPAAIEVLKKALERRQRQLR